MTCTIRRIDRGAHARRQRRVRRVPVLSAFAQARRTVDRRPGEQLEEQQADGIEVGLRRKPAAGELLRRHVRRRAGDRRRCGRRRRALARPKSVMRTLPCAVEHHVGRLQIAMQDAALVRRGEAGAELPRDLDRLVLRQPADASQQRREIFAVDVLHRHEADGRRTSPTS